MKIFCVLIVLLSAGFIYSFFLGNASAGGGEKGPNDRQPSGNGDVNNDGQLNVSDAIYLLDHLFRGGSAPVSISCEAARITKNATLFPSADTVISRDWNDECGMAGPTLELLEASTRSGIQRYSRSALQFELPSAVQEKKITGAVLRLYALVQGEYITNDLIAARLTRAWDAESATWCTAMGADLWSFVGADFSLSGAGIVTVPSKHEDRGSWHAQNGPYEEWISLDVTQVVSAWAADTFPNFGFTVFQFDIPNMSENQGLSFASAEYKDAALRPQLLVEWEE